MNRFSLLLIAGSVFAGLSGCSVFSGGEGSTFGGGTKDYLRAQSIKAIELPEGMTSVPLEPLYPIPKVNATDEFGDNYHLLEYAVPRPEAINSDEQAFGIKIQKLDGERWVYLNVSTSQVWPRTQSFLTNAKLPVVFSNAEKGVIETDWLQHKDDEAVMMRFRIMLEKGIHPDTTEIHIRQIQYPIGDTVPAENIWPASSTNPEKEEWLLRELANELAKTIDNTGASLLGQNVGGATKVGFVSGAREPTMLLRLSDSRAWATLTHSASKEGFIVWGKDESLGVVQVGYNEKVAKKRGFLRRLFGRNDTLAETSGQPFEKVLKHLDGSAEVRSVFDGIEGAGYGDALSSLEEGFLLVASKSAEGTRVIIRDERGHIIPAAQAKTLLKLLRKNLI